NEFRIVDISNPSRPAIVSGLDLGTHASSVAVSGSFAYVGKTNNGVTDDFIVYDISDPTSIATTTGIDFGTSVNALFISGRYAYVGLNTAAGNDFRILDIQNTSIATIGGVDLGSVNTVFVSGKRAYIGTVSIAGSDFRIYDLTGIETQSLLAHSLEAGQAQVRDSLTVGQGLFSNSLNVGLGGIQSTGPLSVFVASTTQVSPVSASFMGGSVGIGTSSIGVGTDTPGALLSVNGNILAQTGTSTFGGLISPSVFSTTSLNFYTASAAAPRVTIDTSGNVGIGTTSPGALFSINGPFLAQGTSTILGGGLNTEALQATGTLAFYTAGTAAPRAVIDSSGNFGIGTTGPSALLSVAGAGYFTGTAGSNVFTVGSTTTQFLVDTIGRVGVATSSPLL
ncbi:MAG: hypothetical protein HYW90_00885, partial [Candidatus Sungbacteria bacterium]|nr:hypothetical protein [Candidatus Sungbacteria bacterium]